MCAFYCTGIFIDRPQCTLRQCNSAARLPRAITYCPEHFLEVCLKHSEKKIILPIANNRGPSKSNLQLQTSFLSPPKQIGSPKVPYIQMKTMQILKKNTHRLSNTCFKLSLYPSSGGGHQYTQDAFTSFFFFSVLCNWNVIVEYVIKTALCCVYTVSALGAWRFVAPL